MTITHKHENKKKSVEQSLTPKRKKNKLIVPIDVLSPT